MTFFALTELCFSSGRGNIFSKEKLEDSVWFAANEFLYPFLTGGLSFTIGNYFQNYLDEFGLTWNFVNWPTWGQFIVFIIILDAVSFFFHYGIHKYTTLWNFHKAHHSTTKLCFLSSFRSSWSNNLLQGIFYGLMTSWLLVDEKVRFLGNTTLLFVCVAQHMNVRVTLPSWIEYSIVTPKNHFWHHSKLKYYNFGQNFGFILTIWDHLFKTYYNPPHYETEIGLSDKFEYTSFFSKLVYPLDIWLVRFIKRVIGKEKTG